MQEENLSYDSGISGCIDFSVESQMLSSSDMSANIDTAIDPSLNSQQLSSLKRDESAFAAATLLQSTDDMQTSYVQTLSDSIDINGFEEELERGDSLHYLTSDGAFHLPATMPNTNGSVIDLATSASESAPPQTSTQPQILGYSSLSTNQSYSYQSLQLPNTPTTQYSTLGQVLTNQNDRGTFPNLHNAFLQYNSDSNSITNGQSKSTPGTSENTFDFRSTRSSKFQRIAKKEDTKQVKRRGDGNKLLSTRATYVLEGWYEANTDWPYPTKAEKQVMASAGGITLEQVNSWFANRRNRSQNTRPKKNMVKLVQAISGLCEEYQSISHGVISAAEMQSRILTLINFHLQRKQ